MMAGRKIFAAIIAALVVSSAGFADMMPTLQRGMEPQPQDTCERPILQHPDSAGLFTPLGVAIPGSLPVGLVSEPLADAEPASGTQSIQVLTDDHKSVSLCLYALLSLGLCRSAPWVKKLSFSVIPQWYHDGGPSQIGHSFAISPDCLCDAPVCCFVQPDSAGEDPMPQYRREIVISLWRKSQFTPTALAARGPPMSSK